MSWELAPEIERGMAPLLTEMARLEALPVGDVNSRRNRDAPLVEQFFTIPSSDDDVALIRHAFTTDDGAQLALTVYDPQTEPHRRDRSLHPRRHDHGARSSNTTISYGSPRAASHQCGTPRMGDEWATSVVNRDCRAHEVDNLRILDTSAFCSCAAVNPARTAAANVLRVVATGALSS